MAWNYIFWNMLMKCFKYILPLKDVAGWCSFDVKILSMTNRKSLTLYWWRQRWHSVEIQKDFPLFIDEFFQLYSKLFSFLGFFYSLAFFFQFRIFLIFLFSLSVSSSGLSCYFLFVAELFYSIIDWVLFFYVIYNLF